MTKRPIGYILVVLAMVLVFFIAPTMYVASVLWHGEVTQPETFERIVFVLGTIELGFSALGLIGFAAYLWCEHIWPALMLIIDGAIEQFSDLWNDLK